MAWASHVPGPARPSPQDCLLSCQNSLSTSKRGQCFESCRSLLRGGGAPRWHCFQTYPSLLSFSPNPEPGLVQLASKAGELGPSFRARQDRAACYLGYFEVMCAEQTKEDTDQVGNSTQACQGHWDPRYLDNHRPALSWVQPVSEERNLQGDQVGAQHSYRA